MSVLNWHTHWDPVCVFSSQDASLSVLDGLLFEVFCNRKNDPFQSCFLSTRCIMFCNVPRPAVLCRRISTVWSAGGISLRRILPTDSSVAKRRVYFAHIPHRSGERATNSIDQPLLRIYYCSRCWMTLMPWFTVRPGWTVSPSLTVSIIFTLSLIHISEPTRPY